ncbi:MAG: hypothetical protein QOD41_1956, partial [Cryptosporangiaceae bacterium]|nr:hypothetical protein [Cryptosporangiaceae bacterium]
DVITAPDDVAAAPHDVVASPPPPRWQRMLRGSEAEPSWVRPSLLVLLVGTAIMYLWGLGASGWANSFYSAAVQAGTQSWKAFFFGSSDAANFITVDKPPAALWIMDISARIFGVNSWSILVPQALEGVASVGLLYAAVRRWSGPVAGLVAGAVLALTPVATLMFKFNNPDALLVLLMIGAAYCVIRAVEKGSVRWLVGASVAIGFAFLTKSLQGLVIVPALALAYLVAAPVSLRKRIVHLLAAAAGMVVSGGWWLAIVELWPASSRPYIGGSQTNSAIELILGYNGLGRITGEQVGSVTPGGGGRFGNGGGMWGATGWNRLFNSENGGQVSWLIPAALVALLALVIISVRVAGGDQIRTDRTRAAAIVWGGWLLTTGLIFSYMKGIFHPYYNIALAPAIGALVGIGSVALWQRRSALWARILLGLGVLGTAALAYSLLGQSPDFLPWLRYAVLIGGIAAAVALVLPARVTGQATAAIAGGALVVALAGPAAYAVQTAGTAHEGSIPSAGPAVAGGFGPGGRGGPGGQRGPGGQGGPGGPGGFGGRRGQFGPPPGGVTGGLPGGGTPGGTGTQGFPGRGGARGGMGGLLSGSAPSAALVQALSANADRYTWVAAAVGSNTASGYQLGTGKPVMAIGGFNGSDPTPTLTAFQQLVAAGKVHYFIGGGGFGQSNGGSNDSSQIATWVQENFTPTTIGGTTLYDLTSQSTTGTGTTT